MFYCKNTFSHTIALFLLPKTLGLSALVLEERVESGAADEEMVVLKGLRKVYLGPLNIELCDSCIKQSFSPSFFLLKMFFSPRGSRGELIYGSLKQTSGKF